MNYPKSDEYMRYDFTLHRYVLTPKYVTDVLGIDLLSRINSGNSPNAEAAVNALLNTASVHVYNYVFQFGDSRTLTWIIAKSPSARDIIRQAMGEQLTFILTVGDLSRAYDAAERANYMDIAAKMTLDGTVRETGRPLTGVCLYDISVPDYECGGY